MIRNTPQPLNLAKAVISVALLAVLFLVSLATAYAGQVTLTWDASPGPDLKGYRLYYGTASRQTTSYPSFVDVGLGNKTTTNGTVCTADASGTVTCTTPSTLLNDGTTYYFGIAAYNSAGVLSGFSNEVYRRVGSSTTPPTASFSANPNPTSGTAPLAVTFTDTSTGAPTNWCWTFGASTNFCDSTAKNPSYTYAQAGTYQVTLTAGNTGGSAMAKSVSVTVSPQSTAPVASFNASPTSGVVPLTVAFTGTSTGGAATTWSWNFGDGTTSTAQNPSKTYSSAGSYTVTLTAIGSGGSNTTTKANYITVTAPSTTTKPTASFSVTPTSGTAPLVATFRDTSTGTVASRSWNFGNGQTSTAQSASITYNTNTAGTTAYTATLTVSNSAGSSTMSKTISVNATAPVASFSASPSSGPAPLAVTFTSTSTGTITSYAWDFGDGTTSTVQNPSKTYANAGTYTVSLKVTGPAGTNTKTQTGYITVSQTSASTGGLVAAYNFEEASGTTAFDTSGQNNHGAITEATYSEGKYGKALNFDGVNDWVTVKDSAALDLTQGMTLEAWVYPTAISGNRTVLVKENAPNSVYYLYANTADDSPNTPIGGGVFAGAYRFAYGSSTLPINTWTHVAVTYDNATERLYVNGSRVASKAQTGNMTVSNGALRIGGNSVWGEFFKGRIDEVRVYNRALSAAEIQTDMNTASGRLLGSQQTGSTDTVSPSMAKAFQQKADKTGKVTSLSVYVASGSTSTSLVAGLYANKVDANQMNHPGTLLAQGTLSSPKAGAWNSVALPATSVTAGTTYWIAILSPGGSLVVNKLVNDGTQPKLSETISVGTLPDSWSTAKVISLPNDGPLAGYGVGY